MMVGVAFHLVQIADLGVIAYWNPLILQSQKTLFLGAVAIKKTV